MITALQCLSADGIVFTLNTCTCASLQSLLNLIVIDTSHHWYDIIVEGRYLLKMIHTAVVVVVVVS